MVERRSAPRKSCSGTFSFFYRGQQRDAQLTDASSAGGFIEAPMCPPAGSVVVLESYPEVARGLRVRFVVEVMRLRELPLDDSDESAARGIGVRWKRAYCNRGAAKLAAFTRHVLGFDVDVEEFQREQGDKAEGEVIYNFERGRCELRTAQGPGERTYRHPTPSSFLLIRDLPPSDLLTAVRQHESARGGRTVFDEEEAPRSKRFSNPSTMQRPRPKAPPPWPPRPTVAQTPGPAATPPRRPTPAQAGAPTTAARPGATRPWGGDAPPPPAGAMPDQRGAKWLDEGEASLEIGREIQEEFVSTWAPRERSATPRMAQAPPATGAGETRRPDTPEGAGGATPAAPPRKAAAPQDADSEDPRAAVRANVTYSLANRHYAGFSTHVGERLLRVVTRNPLPPPGSRLVVRFPITRGVGNHMVRLTCYVISNESDAVAADGPNAFELRIQAIDDAGYPGGFRKFVGGLLGH